MSEHTGNYRLLTRSDFDGLVCAVLLKHLDLINEIKFVHPKDMQDHKVEVTDRDITTNLPYVEGVHLAFDHHSSEVLRIKGDQPDNLIFDAKAPSAARVVYNHYGAHQQFPLDWDEMLVAVDKADSAQFSIEEVIHPHGWALLNFLMDSRTGLGRFREFRISNYELMMDLIDYIKNHTIYDVLTLPDVRERLELYFQHKDKFKQQLQNCSTVNRNLVTINLRNEKTIYAGNRFMVYALNPACSISIHAIWGRNKQNTVFAVGKSIFNRSSNTNIGKLMLQYGGGGHQAAGTCQIENHNAEQVLNELIERITTDE